MEYPRFPNTAISFTQECVNLLGSICGSKVDIVRCVHPGDHLLATTAGAGHCSNFCFPIKMIDDRSTHHRWKALRASYWSHLLIGPLGRRARLRYYYTCTQYIAYHKQFQNKLHSTVYIIKCRWNKSNKMQQLRFLFSMALLYMFRVTISPIIRSTMLYMATGKLVHLGCY